MQGDGANSKHFEECWGQFSVTQVNYKYIDRSGHNKPVVLGYNWSVVANSCFYIYLYLSGYLPIDIHINGVQACMLSCFSHV